MGMHELLKPLPCQASDWWCVLCSATTEALNRLQTSGEQKQYRVNGYKMYLWL